MYVCVCAAALWVPVGVWMSHIVQMLTIYTHIIR